MKILVFAPENSIHTMKWIEYFESRNHEVLLVSFENHKDAKTSGNNRKTRTVYLKLAIQNKIAYFFTFGQLRKIIKQFKPDIVHAQYVSSYGVTGALTGFHPYATSVWGTDIYEAPKQSKILNFLIRYAFKKSEIICSTSVAMRNEIQKYTDKDILLTPFGVNTQHFSPGSVKDKERPFTYGVVKTLNKAYGIEYLIQAYHLLKEKIGEGSFAHTRLIIVGEGPLMEHHQQLASELGLQDQVEFRGKVPHEDVPDIMNELDVFVMPSVWESFGVSALEAQSCGVPVIVTNVGGVPEVVDDGRTGFIVPPEDANALAEKMELLWRDRELRNRLADNAREFVLQRYDWKPNAKILEDAFLSFVQEKK